MTIPAHWRLSVAVGQVRPGVCRTWSGRPSARGERTLRGSCRGVNRFAAHGYGASGVNRVAGGLPPLRPLRHTPAMTAYVVMFRPHDRFQFCIDRQNGDGSWMTLERWPTRELALDRLDDIREEFEVRRLKANGARGPIPAGES
jgi:hypothetical protein